MNEKELKELLLPLLRASASDDINEASAATKKFITVAEEAIKEGVFDGSTMLDQVFNKYDTQGDMSPRFPTHFVTPGTETEFAAYTLNKCGMIPYRTVASDDIVLHSYRIGNSIDACRHHIKNARFDVVRDMMDVYMAGFKLKLQVDAGHTLMAAGIGRAIVETNAAATNGVFSFGLLSKMITSMKRNGGGNSTSVAGYRLTDLLFSPEAMGDLRDLNIDNWTVNRYQAVQDQGVVYNLFGVNFHELFELGQGATLQDYAVNTLGYSMAGGDLELCIGLDLTPKGRKNYVMPVTQEVVTKEDPYLDRMGRWGVYGDMWVSFGVLDNRGIILGSF